MDLNNKYGHDYTEVMEFHLKYGAVPLIFKSHVTWATRFKVSHHIFIKS